MRRLQRWQVAILGVLATAVLVVAMYSGHELTVAANNQREADRRLIDVVELRDQARQVELLNWRGVADQPGISGTSVALRLAVIIERAQELVAREEAADTPAVPAARRAAEGMDLLMSRARSYARAPGPVRLRSVIQEATPEIERVGQALTDWVASCAWSADQATARFRSTAKRFATTLATVVVAAFLIGLVVWMMLERLRRKVFVDVDIARHEQAGLRRVAEMVAADEDQRSVLSVVAQELGDLLQGGVAWVVRVEGSRAFVHGAAFADQGMRERLEHVTEFSVSPGGAVDVALRDGTPTRYVEDGSPAAARLREMEAKVVLAAPINASGRRWGAVVAVGMCPLAWDVGTENLLAAFGRLAGLAVTGDEGRRALTERASTDSLTGLANHGAFHDGLDAALTEAAQTGAPVSLVSLDPDMLTEVNHREGHAEGDRVLAAVARRLAGLTPPGALLARVGGEEFGWVLPGMDRVGAARLADRARRAVGATPVGSGVAITISAGVCDNSQARGTAGMREAADAALAVAKAEGRDRVVEFIPAFLTAASREMRQRDIERVRTLAAVRSLARAVDARDPATQRHSERVAEMTYRIARRAGWSEERADMLRDAALVHDVGKIGVPDDVLRKPGVLTDDEFAQIAAHAALGATIVADVLSQEQTNWVRHHHERVDGRGYPDRLSGQDIPEGARIMAVADAWDAMTADRPYRHALTLEAALAECRESSGTQLDARFVDLAAELVASEPIGHLGDARSASVG